MLAKLDSLCACYCYFPKIRQQQIADSIPQSLKTHNDSFYDHHSSHNLQQTSLQPNKKHIANLSTLMQQNTFHFPHNAASPVYYLNRLLRRKIRILSLDILQHKELVIQKQELREREQNEILIAKAKQAKIPLATHECQFIMKSIDKTNVYFETFFVDSYALCKESLKSKEKMYFINPFDIFSKLTVLFPDLHQYTIILQDKEKHALAHYNHGTLRFCIIVEKKIALQNYFHLLDSLGEVIVCNLSTQSFVANNFLPLESLLSDALHSLEEHNFEKLDSHACLKILVINYCYTVGGLSLRRLLFIPKHFYILQYKIALCVIVGLLFIFISTIHSLYFNYQQQKDLEHTTKLHYEAIENLYHKKKTYPSAYHKIYQSIQKHKSLNFSIQQHYNFQTKQWE
ncbi:hypothetical protein CQA66_06605 [Helicobacter aurati]|uniref:Transmembrane protein n=1 Tax=Helicobacter aurati TaxID=137778 RepID=A0A3D8J1H8_9HELI|nr:hypothetical protein [Helicobacter aurati]RDU71338.1 hypothetical protein CQA66_06605 [Helicobacter aurati]